MVKKKAGLSIMIKIWVFNNQKQAIFYVKYKKLIVFG
jgi:hypothetical protein